MRPLYIRSDGTVTPEHPEVTRHKEQMRAAFAPRPLQFEADDYWPEFETPLPDDGMAVASWRGLA